MKSKKLLSHRIVAFVVNFLIYYFNVIHNSRVTHMSEEVFIPIVAPVTPQSYDDSTDNRFWARSKEIHG